MNEIQEKLNFLFGDKPIFHCIPNTCHKTADGVEVWDSRSVAVVLTIMFYDRNSDEYYIPMGNVVMLLLTLKVFGLYLVVILIEMKMVAKPQ